MQKAAIAYLAPIDGLRAIAVLSVMLYHLNANLLPGGFIGVDIFFVISGFVVSGALPPSGISGIRQLLKLFYSRRATRILPALYTCLFVTSLLSIIFIPYSWLSGANEQTGLAAVWGYSNIVLANVTGDYFAPRAEYNMFTQTWSLGIEEQFYVLFPWLFLPWLTGRRLLSIALFAAGMLISVGCAYLASGTHEVDAFYLIFSRFWELALGVLAFQVSSRAARAPAGPWPILAFTCVAIIGYGLAATAPDRTPYPGSLLPCLATAFLLVSIRAGRKSSPVESVLASRPLAYLGRISYSLYLWHWPIFVLFRWTVGLQSLPAASAATLIVAGAAAASHRYIETPPRQALARGRITPGVTLIAAAILAGLFHPLQRSLWPLRSLISLSTVARHRQDWYPDASTKLTSPSGCKMRTIRDPGPEVPALAFQRSACPPPAAPPRAMFVLGDSHAGAYADLLADYVMTTGAAGRLYVESNCAVLGQKPKDDTCATFIARAIADLERRIKPGDIVFLPGLRIPRIADQFVYFGEPSARALMFETAEQQWRTDNRVATVPVLSRLVATGARVVLEAPTPEFGAPTFRCADWFDRMNPACTAGSTIRRATIEVLRAPVMAEFAAISHAVPGVLVWDPLPLLCPSDICSAYDGDKPLVFDADHLSGYANKKLAPAFRQFLRGSEGKSRVE